jgi:hypothetical protein
MSVNFTGIWRANLAESRFLGPAPQAMLVKIEQVDSELRADMSVTKLDGSEEQVNFQCSTSGEPNKSRLNGKVICGDARWKGNELVIESWVQSGANALHFCDYWSLTADGNTLLMEHREDALAGQITILNRV